MLSPTGFCVTRDQITSRYAIVIEIVYHLIHHNLLLHLYARLLSSRSFVVWPRLCYDCFYTNVNRINDKKNYLQSNIMQF